MERELEDIFHQIQSQQFNWKNAEEMLELTENLDWDSFFQKIFDHRKNFDPLILKSYIPGKKFPAISVTGKECELTCEHCNKKYLNSMLQAPTANKFEIIMNNLIEKGTSGALLSGGCTRQGIVPILKYSKEIQAVKTKSTFFFNAHIGLVSKEEIQQIKQTGIDTVSFDFVLDPRVIQDVFHLQNSPEDYIKTYESLKAEGLRVVPHILIGSYFGKIGFELSELQYISQDPPEVLVFIVMVPPKISMNKVFSLPTPLSIAKLILIARVLFPQTEISVGCMRPRDHQKRKTEMLSIQAGARRMEMPTIETKIWAEKNGLKVKEFSTCCAVPDNYASSQIEEEKNNGKK